MERITPNWAAGGINHDAAKADGWEPILKVVANGYGRLAIVDDADNILVTFDSESVSAIARASEYVEAFLNSASREA